MNYFKNEHACTIHATMLTLEEALELDIGWDACTPINQSEFNTLLDNPSYTLV